MRVALMKRVFLIATIAAVAKPGLAQEAASLVNWSGTYLGAFALHSLETVRGNSKRGDGGYGSNAADEAAHDSFRGAGNRWWFGPFAKAANARVRWMSF